MTLEQVKETFASHIKGETLCLNENVFVDLEAFAELFAEADPTYESLMEVDGGNLGYSDFFAKCKSEGLFN